MNHWDMDLAMPPETLGLKREETELSTSLSLSLLPLPHLNGCESIESTWSDTSPTGMSDSLLSLDFDPNHELCSSVHGSEAFLNSGSLSEQSPQLVTPTDSVHSTLFSPLTGALFTAENAQETAAPPRKRSCNESEHVGMSFPGGMGDFTLFPKEDEPWAKSSLENKPQSAAVLDLLNTLNTPPAASPQQVMTASLPEIHSSPQEAGCTPATLSASVPSVAGGQSTRRRRRDADELLPIDAPIQPRTYHTESATSRRDSGSRASEGSPPCDVSDSPNLGMEGSQDLDPRSLKRLSNTLAARRSRHRKAEELKRLHDTIEELRKEAAAWKKRCEAAEKERDRAWMMNVPM